MSFVAYLGQNVHINPKSCLNSCPLECKRYSYKIKTSSARLKMAPPEGNNYTLEQFDIHIRQDVLFISILTYTLDKQNLDIIFLIECNLLMTAKFSLNLLHPCRSVSALLYFLKIFFLRMLFNDNVRYRILHIILTLNLLDYSGTM